MRKCPMCNKNKDPSEFHKGNCNGLSTYCKECTYIYNRDRSRTKEGIVRDSYSHHKYRHRRSSRSDVPYTLDELRDFILCDEFYALYDRWVESNYSKNLKPSIDRNDDSKGYSLDNIRITTWGENNLKGYSRRMYGDDGVKKPVVGTNIKTGEVVEFISIAEAGRVLDISYRNIPSCIRGKRKSCGGYTWQYK